MIKEQMRTLRLGEIFNREELERIETFLVTDNFKALRKYLNTPKIKKKLDKKEILPDYLFYWFKSTF